MESYRELYYRLFAAIADAVEALERADAPAAKERLIAAMQEAEDKTILIEEDDPSNGEAE